MCVCGVFARLLTLLLSQPVTISPADEVNPGAASASTPGICWPTHKWLEVFHLKTWRRNKITPQAVTLNINVLTRFFFFCVTYFHQACHHRFLFVYGSVNIFFISNTKHHRSPGLAVTKQGEYIYVHPVPHVFILSVSFSRTDSVHKRCPLCEVIFPPHFEQRSFEQHVESHWKVCPVCSEQFPLNCQQQLFERHVLTHFDGNVLNFDQIEWSAQEGRAEICCMGKCVSSAISSFWSGFS